MAKRKPTRKQIETLLDGLSDELSDNSDVRAVGYQLRALASNIAVFALGSTEKRLELEEVLYELASKAKDRQRRKSLRELAKSAKALADYADGVSYDDLTDEELEEANGLREKIHEGLQEWLEAQ